MIDDLLSVRLGLGLGLVLGLAFKAPSSDSRGGSVSIFSITDKAAPWQCFQSAIAFTLNFYFFYII